MSTTLAANGATHADPMIERLLAERDDKANLVRVLTQSAYDAKRDLNPDDKGAIELAKVRIGELDSQLDLIGTNLAMTDEARARLSHLSRSVAPPTTYHRAGEVLYDLLHMGETESASRMYAAMQRAAEHMGTEKTTTVPVAGDLGGLIVRPNVGAVIDPYPGSMPFATAIGMQESSNAMHFVRPRLVDPSFATGAGRPGTGGTLGFEKAELPSKAFEVVGDVVSLVDRGTYLNVSQQLISFVPGALDLIVRHLLKRVAYQIDLALVTEMELSTGTLPLAANAAADVVLKAIYTASAMVYAATGELASWIAMGPLGFARLGGLTDLAGRPLFPTLGPANAMGTMSADSWSGSVAGLRVIVTPAITDDTFWVGNSAVLEGFIFRYPILEAVEPSVMGRQVAVMASTAGYRPIANGAIHLEP